MPIREGRREVCLRGYVMFMHSKCHSIKAMSPSQKSSWLSYRSVGSTLCVFCVGCFASVLSIGSSGSILSIGSTGSILSIGSAGSILSIGSVGSILSIGKRRAVLNRELGKAEEAPTEELPQQGRKSATFDGDSA